LKLSCEDNILWFPLYQKARLVPFADIPHTKDPHITSYKHLWISIKILQASLKQGLDPNYELLLSSVSQAFAGKVILYKLKSNISLLKKDQQKAQEYWDKFSLNCLTQEGYNSTVFFGEHVLNTIPEGERLESLNPV
jgi:hypothetical protein